MSGAPSAGARTTITRVEQTALASCSPGRSGADVVTMNLPFDDAVSGQVEDMGTAGFEAEASPGVSAFRRGHPTMVALLLVGNYPLHYRESSYSQSDAFDEEAAGRAVTSAEIALPDPRRGVPTTEADGAIYARD
jgi:hypothetical protein